MFSFVYRRHSSLQRRRLSVLINFSSVICLTNSFSIITRSLCAKHCIQNSSMVAYNNYISHQAQWQEMKAGQPLESGFFGLGNIPRPWLKNKQTQTKIIHEKFHLRQANSKLRETIWLSRFQKLLSHLMHRKFMAEGREHSGRNKLCPVRTFTGFFYRYFSFS